MYLKLVQVAGRLFSENKTENTGLSGGISREKHPEKNTWCIHFHKSPGTHHLLSERKNAILP